MRRFIEVRDYKRHKYKRNLTFDLNLSVCSNVKKLFTELSWTVQTVSLTTSGMFFCKQSEGFNYTWTLTTSISFLIHRSRHLPGNRAEKSKVVWTLWTNWLFQKVPVCIKTCKDENRHCHTQNTTVFPNFLIFYHTSMFCTRVFWLFICTLTKKRALYLMMFDFLNCNINKLNEINS